ncbi:hypothetical protein IQ07DRAFT_600554 [Pyrenochaeta sp. DS3sAY3a]|nr:hypothetical protein IQ07DRAFT_600554 [Pyrenochaeta sp. DS3sAY3a]
MSEVQSRPARGRSSARGGRGGFGSRGPRKTNGDGASSNIDTSADQGELGELKKRYQSQLSTLKELFPDWTDADLVLAIEESDGDLQTTIEKISEGAVSQFAEVPKKAKDRSRSKAKDPSAPSDVVPGLRGGGRGDFPRRGGDSVRGGRGRGTDRGRGGLRGGRGGAANGPRTTSGSVPTSESTAWDTPPIEEHKEEPKANGQATESESHHVPEAIEKPVAAVAKVAKKTWASMFAAPKPAPAVPKSAPKPAPAPEQPTPVHEAPTHEVAQEPAVQAEELPVPPVADEVLAEPPIELDDPAKLTPDKAEDTTPELTLTPSKDQLTEENVEHLPDTSLPPPTETTHSTVASSKDIGSAVATPLSGPTPASFGRPAVGGYATTALKATAATPHRSASFQRRHMEQQEAVVMPGNHAVDRAAVQFGSLGLGDGADLDVDEDREEAETRTQPPQHSPVAQPRASLPPVPRQAAPQAEAQQESLPTPKPAPGLPPAPQQQPLSQQSPSTTLASQAMQNQGSQSNQSYSQFGRYGQSGIQSDASAPPQKPYDPFGQQIPQTNQYDYPGQQSQAPSQPAAFSSAPDNYSSQYLTAEQRAQYQNYYGGYGQQNAQSQQEAGSTQQRTGSAFGSGPNDSSYSQTQQQQQSRYNDAQNSGHNTPNPTLSGQQGPASQNQHMQHNQQGHYPYSHPYYGSPYYANYVNQFGGYGQGGGYGSFGKGMYGQPHHYGMSPQASFDQHSSSPANAGGFGGSSLHERGSGMGSGLGEYGRSASGASQNPSATAGSGGFGTLPDTFGRPQGYSNQSSYGQQQSGQQGLNEDSLKPFSDSKSSGPSPSALGSQPGRPESATQNAFGQGGQGALPQQQQGFNNYPGHLSGNNQYGGLGGLGHQTSGHGQQQSGYGNYGGFGGGYGGGSYNRGGWGGNYGQH